MAFPQTPLDIDVELNIGGTWTDVTSYVRGDSGIDISRGYSREGGSVDPAQCSLTLENTDGRFSPRNPSSPYYGQLGRNTPIRVSVHGGEPYLHLPGDAGDRVSTPDAASLDITGDIDIRMELTMENYHVGSTTELVGKYNVTGNQRSWRLMLGTGGTLLFSWSPDGTAFTDVESTKELPGGGTNGTGRMAIRVTFNTDNGASEHDAKFYIARTINGPWDQLGDTVTFSGTTSIFSSTANLEIGDISNLSFDEAVAKIHKLKIYNGIDGALVANPDFTIQTVGATSFSDSLGLTWTLAGNTSISDKQTRFVGEVSSWPLRWDTGGFDVTTTIEAAGILRRLGQNQPELQSALRRTIPADSNVVAYWPMEDGVGTTESGSPIDGVRPARTTGFTFEAEEPTFSGLPAGSASLPQISSGAELNAIVPFYSSTEWQVEFLFKIPADYTTFRTLMYVRTAGTVKGWRIQLNNANARLIGEDIDGTALFTSTIGSGDSFFGGWRRVRLRATQNGGNIDWNIQWFTLDGNGLNNDSGSYAGTIGRVYRLQSPPGGGYSADLGTMGIGHIAVFSSAPSTTFTGPATAFAGDTAGERMERLSLEEDVLVVVSGLVDDEITVGPQTQKTFLDLITECAEADCGLLFERRGSTAIAYRDRYALYDQGTTLSLDYETDVVAPFEPVDDDQSIANDIAVKKEYGSTGYAVDEDSTMSVNDPPDGVGRYSASYTLNLNSDDSAAQIAGWKLRLGTIDKARFPAVRVSLARSTDLIEDAALVDIGDRITVTNPPAWLPPDDIELLVIGYQEQISQFSWDITYICVPYDPYFSGQVEEGDYDRVDTAGCQLNEALDTTETGVDVLTTATYRWVDSATYPTDFPFDIIVGGEVMRVTACTGTTTSQTFTVTRSINGVVKSHSSGTDVRLFKPAYVVL
jgi:hypothetical protein